MRVRLCRLCSAITNNLNIDLYSSTLTDGSKDGYEMPRGTSYRVVRLAYPSIRILGGPCINLDRVSSCSDVPFISHVSQYLCNFNDLKRIHFFYLNTDTLVSILEDNYCSHQASYPLVIIVIIIITLPILQRT